MYDKSEAAGQLSLAQKRAKMSLTLQERQGVFFDSFQTLQPLQFYYSRCHWKSPSLNLFFLEAYGKKA